MMRSRLYYWRRLVWDYFRYGQLPGWVASRALSVMARWQRGPLLRLGLLTRAARVRPKAKRLAQLLPAMRADLDQLDAAGIDWEALGGPARNDMGKGIILKPPVSPREKGVLYLTFEKQWLRLLRSGKTAEIAERYDLVLGPSTSPPPHVEQLLLTRLWPGRVYTLLSNFDDAELLRQVSPRLRTVPLLASSWVDPDDFVPHLGGPKEYDLVMLAHFDPVKRHWLLFEALRKLPRSFRVLLMGVPLGGRTEKDLRDEAHVFGVADRFELKLRPSRAEVMAGLARGKVSLVFSKQEGACIAVTESLFADTPVGLFRNARVGSRAFINDQTGRLLDRRGLARQLVDFVNESERFRPRRWAIENISCHRSRAVLNEVLKSEAEEWTRDLLRIRKDLLPSYLSVRDEEAMRPWYEDFAERYGLLLGPAARPGWLRRGVAAA
jgi:glycosyltransferase involved in cell wall biosynthesis